MGPTSREALTASVSTDEVTTPALVQLPPEDLQSSGVPRARHRRDARGVGITPTEVIHRRFLTPNPDGVAIGDTTDDAL